PDVSVLPLPLVSFLHHKLKLNKMVSQGVLCVLMLVSFHMSYVSGICCPSYRGLCQDATEGTSCCGYGPCNIFCCNCDGGCRRGSGRGRLFPNQTDVTFSNEHTPRDENNDDVPDEQEAATCQQMLPSENDLLFAAVDSDVEGSFAWEAASWTKQ
ncbi:unnamed protein product, partial [Allacma fusca]